MSSESFNILFVKNKKKKQVRLSTIFHLYLTYAYNIRLHEKYYLCTKIIFMFLVGRYPILYVLVGKFPTANSVV